MTRSRDEQRGQPRPIDDNEDRMGEMEELSFPNDEPTGRIGDRLTQAEIDREQPAERASEAGLTGAAMPGEGPTDDDLSPETLIEEDGARSPNERGSGPPADRDLTVTDESHIGGGDGLDEAELGRAKPLDGKRWDGDPAEPLRPATSVDRDNPVTNQGPQDADEEE